MQSGWVRLFKENLLIIRIFTNYLSVIDGFQVAYYFNDNITLMHIAFTVRLQFGFQPFPFQSTSFVFLICNLLGVPRGRWTYSNLPGCMLVKYRLLSLSLLFPNRVTFVVEAEGVIDVHYASLTSQGVQNRVFYLDGH